MANYKRLFKSSKNRVFSGVAGGIAEYFVVDPLLIRILFVVLALCGGGGVLLYLILLIVVPTEPYDYYMNDKKKVDDNPTDGETTDEIPEIDFEDTTLDEKKQKVVWSSSIIGLIFILLGLYVILSKFCSFNYWEYIFPIVLILIGIIIILTVPKKQKKS
ncbi:MAG: PspC domain-containing protein [Bacteroidales bacterium]|jgi:phage shock protein C|nr:PspC domain-containing protein [Bacteroidales bacterium]